MGFQVAFYFGKVMTITQQLFFQNIDKQRFKKRNFYFNTMKRQTHIIQGVSKKTLRKFNRLSCIINVAKQFNFYIGRKNSYLAFQ